MDNFRIESSGYNKTSFDYKNMEKQSLTNFNIFANTIREKAKIPLSNTSIFNLCNDLY